MRDATGTLIGYSKVTRDLTQRRGHEEALRQSEERFRLLVEGVGEYAIFMLDVNGRVATWNVGAQRIKGYTAENIIGQHFSLFYPQEARDSGWPDHELLHASEKAASTTPAGVCARTARRCGRTSTSRHCATMPDVCWASPS